VEADVAAMWGKRLAQWKLEKEARNRLMQDVMETRRNQLKERSTFACFLYIVHRATLTKTAIK